MSKNPAASILIPSALQKVHPALQQVETSLKSIKDAIGSISQTVNGQNVTPQLSALQSQVSSLQTEVNALEAEVAAISQTIYMAAIFVPAFSVVYESVPGMVTTADFTIMETSYGVVGITSAQAAIGKIVAVAKNGDTVTNPNWNWTIGPVFLGTGGQLTQTPMSVTNAVYQQQIGFAVSTTSVVVLLGEPIYFGSSSAQLIVARPDGSLGIGALQPPAFAYASNPGTVITSTTANNVVDTRTVAKGAVSANQILECTFRCLLSGTNNTKSLLVGISADLTNALTAVFSAAQTGIVTFTASFLIGAGTVGNPHILVSDVQFQQQIFAVKRGTVTVNVATTAFNLLTEAWVANSSDSITIDSVSWRLIGNGY